MTLFEQVRDSVSMAETALFYGFTPNRAGFINCPFHDERTPSCKLYQNRFKCFGCGAAGDQVDFVARLLGLSSLDAAKRLNDDLRLGLQLNRDPPDHSAREARQLFEEWRHQFLNKIDAAIRTANLADFSHLSDREATALVYREAFEYWASVLLHGDLDDQMEIFRNRGEVDRLCLLIIHGMPQKSKTA